MNSKKMIVLLVVMMLLSVSVITVFAQNPNQAECEFYGGTYVRVGDRDYCYNEPIANESLFSCPEGIDFYSWYRIGGGESVLVGCGYIDLSPLRCKFKEVKNGYLGGTIETVGLGEPSFMKLMKDEQVYKLPLVVGSLERFKEPERWEAEFSTVDPASGEVLVPPGTYTVMCYGLDGTKNGSELKVTIGR